MVENHPISGQPVIGGSSPVHCPYVTILKTRFSRVSILALPVFLLSNVVT